MNKKIFAKGGFATSGKRKIKIVLTLIVFLFVFALGSAIKTKAGVGENSTGWLWGGSDDGAGNNTGLRWVSMNNTNTGGAFSYGVNIPAAGCVDPNCNVTGYAWSGGDNSSGGLGFINFDPAGPYPNIPAYSVKRVGNGLEGWARFEEIRIAQAAGNSGGWLGWIKLKGIASSGAPYGVTVNADGTLVGFGWSDELGWIDFSRAQTAVSSYNLTVATGGTGAGKVTGGSVIDCNVGNVGTCAESFVPGTSVTLTAAPSAGTSFTGWGGACSGNGACTVTMSASQSVTATFALNAPCVCSTGCEANTCTGTNCNNSCGNSVCPGTKNCDTGWIEVAP